jgi:hypothetical protein
MGQPMQDGSADRYRALGSGAMTALFKEVESFCICQLI